MTIVLVVLVLILATATAYLAINRTAPTPSPAPVSDVQQPVIAAPTQQNVPINNSQTYNNKKSGYSISVPKDWTYMEESPTPFVATHFFGAIDKNTQLLFIDRFETNKQSNDEIKKDLMAWAKNDMSVDTSSEGKASAEDCKDGTAQIADIDNVNYQAVIIDCPKRDTESYNIFTLDRHYQITSPLSYKNKNAELYNGIYKSFLIE